MQKYYLYFFIPLINKNKYKLNYIYSFELNKTTNTPTFPKHELISKIHDLKIIL